MRAFYARIKQYMNKQRKSIILFVAIPLLILSVIMTVRSFEAEELQLHEETEAGFDLENIIERGVIRAVADYSSTNYFVYRGEPMGFHLDLLKQFAAHIGVDLELSVANGIQESIDALYEDDGSDIIARNLTVTNSRRQHLAFTEPHSRTRQVLVQRKPSQWYNMRASAIEDNLIRSQLDLGGKTVHVQKNSSSVMRLRHLMEEIGDTIFIVEREESSEQLIELVANGDIDYTVSDDNLARLNEMYFANIDAQTPLSFEQNLSWAVRKDSPQLLEAIDSWLKEFRNTRQYADIYNKYFNNPRSVFIAKSELHSLGGGRISDFDEYFKRYADIVGWDWRLIASLSYQESRFNPSAVSWAGAFGIMQLMPGTADMLNVDENSNVQEHISAGIRYLRWLDERLSEEIMDEQQRTKFVLASYNAGLGHVLDARRLAEKYGKDPNVWRGSVDYFLLNKSNPKYYLDPVVRHGYARGSEPYHYVSEIMERYRHYKNALSG